MGGVTFARSPLRFCISNLKGNTYALNAGLLRHHCRLSNLLSTTLCALQRNTNKEVDMNSKAVYTLIKEGANTREIHIGTACTQKDGSIKIVLDTLPISGIVIIPQVYL